MKATSSSWKRVPFGDVTPLSYTASFDEQQLARLKEGLVPEAMEDKWFVYYEDPHLFFHRSWTGQPVYRITLTPEGAGARAIQAHWSKDLASADHADPEYQSRLLDFLISNLMLGQSKPFPRPQGLNEPAPGIFQHHVSGTGFRETAQPRKPWWKWW
jgi:hypothetical protein